MVGWTNGAASYRILFTGTPKELLWNCMLFMGESAINKYFIYLEVAPDTN